MPVYRIALPAVLALSLPMARAETGTVVPTVVVASQRADVVSKIDRKVYRTGADLQSVSGTAADVLNNVPSVDVDIDGNISLRGDASVTVLIDGQPSGQMQGAARAGALMGMSAADIEAVEVITSPSAEFKPDGTGGIINIITKKQHKRGSSGQLITSVGNDGRHNGSVSGSYNTGALDLSGTLGNRQDWRRRINDNQTGAPGAVPVLTHQIQDESSERWSGKGALKYTPSPQQSMGVTLDYATRSDQRSLAQQTIAPDAPLYQRFGSGGGPRTDGGLALTLDQKFALPGEALALYAAHSHSSEENLLDYTTDRNFDQVVYDISRFSSAYTRPVGESAKLKAGYEVEYDHNSFNNWNTSATAANHFRYRLAINAAYATFSARHGALEALGGLRFEQADIRTLLRDSGDRSTQRYRKLYPSLNLLYTLNDAESLAFGYSKRVKKPDPEDVNPYINAADPKNLRQGNPALRPQITDALELAYRYEAGATSYSTTAYYRRSQNGDGEVLQPLANDVVLITKVNLPTIQSGGVEFGASGKLAQGLSYNLSGNAFYNEINGQQVQGGSNHSDLGLNGKGTLDYQLAARDRVQLGFNYRGKRLTAQGYVMPFNVVNVGYRHQINEQCTLVATLSDAFNTQRQRRIYETPTFNGSYARHQLGQVAYIGLAFSFGGTRKAKDTEFNYD